MKTALVALWLVVAVAIFAMYSSAGEQMERTVAVQQVEDSEAPYHVVRNFRKVRGAVAVTLCGLAGFATIRFGKGK